MIYYRSDLAQSIQAALILSSQVYCNGGGRNPEFVSGMLTMAEHYAHQYGLNWGSILHNVREALDADALSVLDRSLQSEVWVSAD